MLFMHDNKFALLSQTLPELHFSTSRYASSQVLTKYVTHVFRSELLLLLIFPPVLCRKAISVLLNMKSFLMQHVTVGSIVCYMPLSY